MLLEYKSMIETAMPAQTVARDYFSEIIETHIKSCDALEIPLEQAANTITQSLLGGNKVLCYGFGKMAYAANAFVSNLSEHFEVERPSLPAIALNCQAQNTQQAVKLLRSLGNSQDIFVTLVANKPTSLELDLIDSAKNHGLTIVALTGQNNNNIADFLNNKDVELCVASERLSIIASCYQTMLACLCLSIEAKIFGYATEH